MPDHPVGALSAEVALQREHATRAGMRVVGIIPARAGSKGLPGKNLRLLAGKPLIAWTIEAALRSRVLDRVIVSTEDEEIAAVARAYGAEVPFLRPAELAGDETPGTDVVLHAVSWLEDYQQYRPEFVMLLQPTSPLRRVEDIVHVMKDLHKQGADGVVSVCEILHHHPCEARKRSPDGWLEDKTEVGDSKKSIRQHYPRLFSPNGAIYCARRDVLLKQETFYSSRTYPYDMPPERSIDIDSAWDFTLAEMALKAQRAAPPSVEVAGRQIGAAQPCFVIAEAGANHNGDLAAARRLIDAARAAGADAVKFQTFKAERLVTKDAPKAQYQMRTTGERESQLEMLRQLELSPEAHQELKAYCHDQGILFMSSPFDLESVDFLAELEVAVFKIPSGEITNLPLLSRVASYERPIILSTGMSTLEEVAAAIRVIEEAGGRQLVLLHCVSSYPTEPADANLRAMHTMAEAFNLPVGFSDHTPGIEVALTAVAMGACVIEKHLTLDRGLPGPDHQASLEPDEFARLVQGIRQVEQILGHGRKEPAACEAQTAAVARKSLVAAKAIPKGMAITEELIAIKRPGTGIEPSQRAQLIGQTVRRDIREDTLLEWNMVRDVSE